ncbi:MAG: hypothetical protein AAGA20_19055 [Planctomycetota bacterium]
MTLDLEPIVREVRRRVDAHRLPGGGFARWTRTRPAVDDPYGCADAVHLLVTVGDVDGPDERLAEAVRRHQGADGLFREETHHELHTTAHCLAALALLDARARWPIESVAASAENVEAFLDGLAWADDPWRASHRGAGLWSALTIADEGDRGLRERWLDWVVGEVDEETGLLRRGAVGSGPLWDHLAGTFHYQFCFEHAGRSLPFPEARVETCLRIAREGLVPFDGYPVGFCEVDLAYCLARSVERSGHRAGDVRSELQRLAERHVQSLSALISRDDPALDDLHGFFGAVCAFAELQRALPGELASDRPLVQVLDRRPFI